MHEYQRIVVERNNELAQHVIIIHMFDKYKRVGEEGGRYSANQKGGGEKSDTEKRKESVINLCVCVSTSSGTSLESKCRVISTQVPHP